jgi:hypothetical protein
MAAGEFLGPKRLEGRFLTTGRRPREGASWVWFKQKPSMLNALLGAMHSPWRGPFGETLSRLHAFGARSQ